MNDFKQVRENMINMLEDLDEHLEGISGDVKHQDESDVMSDSSENIPKSIMERIKHAISRIDNGTYDVCLSCGQTIKKKQLKALPFSGLCIQCAEKKDHDKG